MFDDRLSLNTKDNELTNVSSLTRVFMDTAQLPELIKKMDNSERENRLLFEDFTDHEILYYYVHYDKNRDREKSRAPGTKKEYLRELLKFAHNLVSYSSIIGVDINQVQGNSLFKSLSPRHIARYQVWMEKEEPLLNNKTSYSSATLARKNTIIKSFLDYLYKNKYINVNLTERMKSSTVNDYERPNRDLGPGEVIQILDYFYNEERDPILAGLIHVLVTTGIRNSELCNATIKDLQYDSIAASYTLSFRAKGNKQRIVPIKNKVYKAIVEYRKARGLGTVLSTNDSSPLLPNAYGNAYTSSYLSKYIKASILRTNLAFLENRENPITPHTFRHAFAVISYQSGADIYTIQKSLGHESYRTTAIYLQKILDLNQNAIHSWEQGVMKKYI